MATRLHAEAYMEYIYGSSNKFYSIALLENPDGTWSAAFNYGPIDHPRGWGLKAAGVTEAVARKAYDAALRDKSDYTLQGQVKAYAAYPDVVRVGLSGPAPAPISASGATAAPAKQTSASARPAVVVPTSAGGTGINRVQPSDGGVPRFPAQLCGANGSIAPVLADPGRFAVEEKFDGFRGLVSILPGGRFEIRNRDGVNTGRIENTPGLRAALVALVDKVPALATGTLLDGELVGRSWNETATLLSAKGGSDKGLRYVVFDVPWLAGRDLRALPLRERRVELTALAAHFDGTVLVLSKLLTPAADLAERIWAAGGEGLIVKDWATEYTPGDRRKWLKIKEVRTADGIILGYEGGHGKYVDTTGAVAIGQYRAGKLVEVCKLSGMTDAVRKGFDESMVGKVVEFAYHQRTADSYRHPRWRHWRPDKAPEACTWEATE
jgi:hypothetical protein